MWADVNIKPMWGLLFFQVPYERMYVPVKYGDDVKQRNMHPMLLPIVETERLIIPEKIIT